MSVLELKRVDKIYYGGYTALLNVSFLAESGISCFIGESGSGKSTLLKIIGGVEKISNGSILLDDNDISNLHIRDRAVGFFDSDFPQIKGRKIVFDIIAYPLKLRDENREEIGAKVNNIARLWGVQDLLRYRADMLSEYQKALVGLARLTVTDRKIYLLDNPLKNLYCKERLRVARKIAEYFKESDKIALYATDWVDEALELQPRKMGILAYSGLSDYGEMFDILQKPNTLAAAKIFDRYFNIVEGKLSDNKLQMLNCEINLANKLIANIFENIVAVFPQSSVILGEGDFIGEIVNISQRLGEYELTIQVNNDHILTSSKKRYITGEQIKFDIDRYNINIYDIDSEFNLSAKEG